MKIEIWEENKENWRIIVKTKDDYVWLDVTVPKEP